MKQTVDFKIFKQAFKDAGREGQFPNGLRALFDYLENYEESVNDEEMELDVISLCCDYTETTWEEFKAENLGIDSFVDLYDITTVISIDDAEDNPTFIYQNF